MSDAASGPRASSASESRIIAGRYGLGAGLGSGGSAQVYRAADRSLGREVAVKLFPSDLDPEDRERQHRELSLLAELHHPNLVDLFDAGEDNGRLYLVMRLIPGESLAERLGRHGPLPTEVAVRIGAGLSDALAYIHDHGITHRDVKPANVLLGERPMLGDFGIARAAGGAQVTSTGFVIGTPAYMAPEQVRGQVVGPAADIYALGLVVLEMLSGQREYDGPGAEAAVARLARPPAVPPLPVGLDHLLHRMTKPDAADRPRASEVAASLANAGAGLRDGAIVGSAAHAASMPTRQQTLVAPATWSNDATSGAGGDSRGSAATAGAARRPLAVVGALVVLAVLLGLGIALFGGGGGNTGSTVPSTTPATASSSQTASRTTTATTAPPAATDAGGTGSDGGAGRGGDDGRGNRENEGGGNGDGGGRGRGGDSGGGGGGG